MALPIRMRANFQLAIVLLLGSVVSAHAASTETSNGCRGTQDDPCIRSGSCEIQGALWDQDVTVDRADIFDTQGWPGLCDMVHVALVQGNCDPPGAQIDVTVQLSQTSTAWIPQIIGPLVCAGEVQPPEVPAMGVLGRGILVALIIAGSLAGIRNFSA
jgi:hypothetical protein